MASNFCQDDDYDLQSFTLIWLDSAVHNNENKSTQNDLRTLTKDFKLFDNNSDCESYIKSLSSDHRLVLITSGRLGRQIVPCIHELEQVHSIYVYCLDRQGNKQWVINYSKINNVLTEKDELIQTICRDNRKEIYAISDERLYLNIFTDDADNEFIYTQILLNYMLTIQINSTILTSQLTSDEIQCNENTLELDILKEFQQNNSSEQTFDSLMKDKSLLNLLFEALKTKNINLLYRFHSFICHVNRQLELNQCSKSKHLYYSYLITDEEFEQLKNSEGKLISINKFFVTTSHYDEVYSALKTINDSQKILFDIYADPSIVGIKPFADMKSLNKTINQSQTIFMLGSIFRIKKILQQDEIWVFEMTLSSQCDADLKQKIEMIQKENGDGDTDLLAYPNFLAHIGQYDNAEKYYQYLLHELPSDHVDIHIIYRSLGNSAYLKRDYDKSLEHHLKSLEIKKCLLNCNDRQIADSYNCLGIVYFNLNNYKKAIESYETAINILKLIPNSDEPKIAACLSNIALVYRTEKNYSKALQYYKTILQIEKECLSENHSDLGQTYHNVGALYWCCGYFDEALEYYHFALENKYHNLSFKDPSIAMTLENMGLVHENKNDFQQALDYYEKAAAIYRQALSSTHLDVLQIQNNISRALSHLKQRETS